jgi:hypothetical protein
VESELASEAEWSQSWSWSCSCSVVGVRVRVSVGICWSGQHQYRCGREVGV